MDDEGPTQKECTHCGREKSLANFSPGRGKFGRHSWCRVCHRLAVNRYHHTEAGRAARAAYAAKPEVKERRRERERAEARRRTQRAWLTSPRGKLFHGRQNALARLKRAQTEEQRAHYRAVIALHDREIARLDAAHELPAEPPRPRP